MLITWDQVLPFVRGALAATPVETVIVTGEAHTLDFAARLELEDGDVDAADLLAADPTDRHLDADIDVAADLAHLAYTGGTTGVSKGVELPHRNVVVNVLQSACWTSGSVPALDEAGDVTLRQVLGEDEQPTRLGEARIVNLTPWFHAMGAIGYLNGLVMGGTTTVIHMRFDPVKYVEDAVKYDVTAIGGAPPVFVALLQVPGFADHDWSRVRGVSSGAAPLPVALIEKLRSALPNAVIGEGYGLTEVTMQATGNPSFRSGTRKAGTVGVPVFDTEISIRPLGGGDALPPGERGEVCIRGPQVMRGYAHRPDATAESIDADGWFHSGDVGIIDEDGYLSIVDRTKDMLLYKGYNVFPRDLEEILFGVPGVAGAAVVGRPDEEAGELPVAYVVRKANDAGAALTTESVMAAVNDKVTPYKRLRDVVFIDAIPVSAAGKVLKRELAAREREKVSGRGHVTRTGAAARSTGEAHYVPRVENERVGPETEHTGVQIAHEEASPVRQVWRRVIIGVVVLLLTVGVIYLDRDGYRDGDDVGRRCWTPSTTRPSRSPPPATATSRRSLRARGWSTSC